MKRIIVAALLSVTAILSVGVVPRAAHADTLVQRYYTCYGNGEAVTFYYIEDDTEHVVWVNGYGASPFPMYADYNSGQGTTTYYEVNGNVGGVHEWAEVAVTYPTYASCEWTWQYP